MNQKTTNTSMPVGTSYILRDNLISALSLAIERLRISEERQGYTGPSIMRAGFMENLAALQDGQYFTVRD